MVNGEGFVGWFAGYGVLRAWVYGFMVRGSGWGACSRWEPVMGAWGRGQGWLALGGRQWVGLEPWTGWG